MHHSFKFGEDKTNVNLDKASREQRSKHLNLLQRHVDLFKHSSILSASVSCMHYPSKVCEYIIHKNLDMAILLQIPHHRTVSKTYRSDSKSVRCIVL